MKVIKTIAEARALRRQLTGSLGFVPTMGYLHEGHLTLVRHSRAENRHTAVSIFVNPTQFSPKEDYQSYPRDEARDLAMLEAERTDFVFMPSEEEIYPRAFSTWVEVTRITDRLEGAVRPGHFRGVATVVNKLFNIIEPTRAYFGQKDAQQVTVIQRMAADLNMNLQVVVAPTVREPDGLAMSSRNVYLTPAGRKAAPVLFRSLQLAREMWAKGEKDAGRLRQAVTAHIEAEPLARLDYVSVADTETLEELSVIDRPALVSLAVKLGKPRLMDNILLG
ncbi:MAG: Pantothenate synthetase [Dehalococcoidia bacterium]|nr:Pantothenate synthetase [Dehalococcoidia bacterium]